MWNPRWAVLISFSISQARSCAGYTDAMNAAEPIDTHEFPLDHEPVEDWQRVEPAASAQDDSVAVRDSHGNSDRTGLGSADGTVGSPEPTTTAFAELGTIAGAEYGLWEMSAGAMRDVEGDEVFLVISGTGRVEFDEPQRTGIALAPGVLVRLEAGMKTRWYIDEVPLRKLFIAPTET